MRERAIPKLRTGLSQFLQIIRNRAYAVVEPKNSVTGKEVCGMPKVQEPVGDEQQTKKRDDFGTRPRWIICAQAEPGQRWILQKEGSSVEKVSSPAQVEQ